MCKIFGKKCYEGVRLKTLLIALRVGGCMGVKFSEKYFIILNRPNRRPILIDHGCAM